MPAHNASQILLAYHFLLQSPWQVVRPHREHFPEVEGVRQKQRGCQLPRFESFEWEFTASETTRNLHTENWLHHLQRGGIEIQASMQDNGRETIQNLSTCSMSWYVMIQHGKKKKTKQKLQTHAESLEIEGRSVTNVLTKDTALAGNCTLPSFTSETWKQIWKNMLNAKRDRKMRRNPGRSRNTVPGSIDLYTQWHLLHLKARQRRQNIEDSLYGTNLASLHILTFPMHTGVWTNENSLAKLLDLSSCERDP